MQRHGIWRAIHAHHMPQQPCTAKHGGSVGEWACAQRASNAHACQPIKGNASPQQVHSWPNTRYSRLGQRP
jgi:hypothetical protein